MSLPINLRHLENKSLELYGQLTPAELGLETGDEMISVNQPLEYELEAQRLEDAVLVQGRLELPIECECVRCLKRFHDEVVVEDWICHLPLEGEEKALIVNDCVDLTPYIREDIFLAFPQHPLCDPQCSGLGPPEKKPEQGHAADGEIRNESSPWSPLDKLKL
jgi:uncharacterized protein